MSPLRFGSSLLVSSFDVIDRQSEKTTDALRPQMCVAEIVCFLLETELLHTAKAVGCRTLDGSGMAVFQAAEAFRLFTGIAPDAERMREQFDSI